MESLSLWNLKFPLFPFPQQISNSRFYGVSRSTPNLPPHFRNIRNKSCTVRARKKSSKQSEPILQQTPIKEVSFDDEDDLLFDDLEEGASIEDDVDDNDFDDDDFNDDDYDEFGDDYIEDEDEAEAETYTGDGGAGGGISLAGTWWDKEALALAQEVTQSFDGDLGIYAFRTLLNNAIKVRIEKLSNTSGSPNMQDIEAYTRSYRARLDEAEIAKTVPDNLYLEVSSPGVERIVRIPDDLERFKDRPMYVKYLNEVGTSSESDGVFRLILFDVDMKYCTWGIADVKVNREKAGKGRLLNKKQREWRLTTSFDSLRIVHLHFDF